MTGRARENRVRKERLVRIWTGTPAGASARYVYVVTWEREAAR